MFWGTGFICSMENVVSVCAASLVEKERCKETKWRYDRVEKAARIVGRARDCLPLKEINFGVTVSFVCLVVLGRGLRVSINVVK